MLYQADRALVSILFACLAAAACATIPLPPEPDRISQLTGAELDEPADVGAYRPSQWWKTFDDPVLDEVIEAVLVSNFDLAEAVARVEQARERARLANAVWYPALAPALGADDSDSPANVGIGAQLDEFGLGSQFQDAFGFVPPDRFGLTTWSVAARFSYELDFWGRDRYSSHAAGAERLASEADYQAARIGIVAEAVGTYLEIADLRLQQRLAGETADIFEERERLAQSRYTQGLGGVGDLYAARKNLAGARAELPRIESRLASAEGRLWILLGGYRAELASRLPDAPLVRQETVPAGIPAGVVMQRPDVGAARQRMEAARFAVGARRAELLPSLSLSGSIGLQSAESGSWFDPDQWFRHLTVNLLGPTFQGTRLQHKVALAEAELDAAAAAYGRSVVTATHEIEAALAGWEAARRRHDLLAAYAGEVRTEASLQQRRYRSGVGNYKAWLASSEALLIARSALGSAQSDLGHAQLALHRAVGGVWVAGESSALHPETAAPVADSKLAAAVGD